MQHIISKLSAKAIKRQISPKEFYQAEIDLKTNREHGWVDGGLCPFHNDKRRCSFYVSQDTGRFNCFSCGAKGGDIIDFLQLRDEVTFPEALCYLHKCYGVG